jgi:hypothetical protein
MALSSVNLNDAAILHDDRDLPELHPAESLNDRLQHVRRQTVRIDRGGIRKGRHGKRS